MRALFAFAPAFAVLAVAATAHAQPEQRSVNRVDIEGVSVTFTLPIEAVDRAVRVPITVAATMRDALQAPPPAFVDVSLCASWRCGNDQILRVPVNGPAVHGMTTLWPQGLQARVRAGASEASCCSNGRTGHVVAFASPGATLQQLVLTGPQNDGRFGGAMVEHVGDLFTRSPALLDGVSALVLPDDTGITPAIEAWIERGGVASISQQRGDTDGVAVTAPRACVDGALANANISLAVPAGTGVSRVGAGVLVHRVSGASEAQQIAGVLAAQPTLRVWMDSAGVEDQPAVRAASVALVHRPPIAVAFLFAL
ncbi:MAG TPA: hypothetical protein VGO62_18420, partial [Myxococcota bacterium]